MYHFTHQERDISPPSNLWVHKFWLYIIIRSLAHRQSSDWDTDIAEAPRPGTMRYMYNAMDNHHYNLPLWINICTVLVSTSSTYKWST